MADRRDPDTLAGRGIAAMALIGGGVILAVLGAYGLWGIDGASLVGGILAAIFGIALAWE